MESSELDYDLPRELVAQHPAGRRDESRLLVYTRKTGEIEHRVFSELPEVVPSSLAVVNDTRVVPARFPIERPRGEVLLLEQVDGDVWEALARPSRKLRAGERYGAVQFLEHLGAGRWRVRLEGDPGGSAPLPPYITEPLADPERYQTVYARERGSAAAPTAGLHFTPELLARLDVERVTLHVGLDTFQPLRAETVEEHHIHAVRVLETLAAGGALGGRTELFITPGFAFRRVDHLVTNFHLPRSTLLALVMAFAGIDEVRRLYALAIEERYRFYSFGDAMLIL
jgi:S-adenosylmethionine:tRNA ribosyltransferase-isomerase